MKSLVRAKHRLALDFSISIFIFIKSWTKPSGFDKNESVIQVPSQVYVHIQRRQNTQHAFPPRTRKQTNKQTNKLE